MREVIAFAEIRLWDHLVGGVAELDDGSIVFEYDESFRRRGHEISPFHLPLALSGPVRFDELRKKAAFRGLPGVLADALPDSFGKNVIRAYYTAQGQVQKALSPVQHLLYVGERAIGALRFHPPENPPLRSAEAEALEIATLVTDARKIIAGWTDVTLPEIYRLGSSAGGMRPKAVVLYNKESDEIRSAFAVPKPGDIPCLLKFDGVSKDATPDRLGTPAPFNRVEAAYARMARDAGLDVVDVMLLESPAGHAHLLIPRFDRPGPDALHQHTLGGLLHVDYNEPGASSYEEYLRTILRLGLPPAAVTEGYRRMAFNILGVNQDDHVKNFSFHMNKEGKWSLTPAYDITFAKGENWTLQHQMRVAGKRTGIRRKDLLEVGAKLDVRAPEKIIDRVSDVLARWPQYAREMGVPSETIDLIQRELRARAAEVG